jgi:AsmA protein
MGKLLKLVFTLIAVVVGLVLVLVIALPFFVDPNDYKDEIAAAVAKQTGRTLTIDGDIGLSVFPWLGLDIGSAQLSNAAGFGDKPMASMEQVQVRVKLLPLLRKELEMDTVKLNGLHLSLARDENGRTNWEDLQGEAAPDSGKTDKQQADTVSPLAGLAIGGVEVTDAQVVWDDRSAASHYEINDLSFTTGAIMPGQPFDLELHFRVAATQPAVNGTLDLEGSVLIAPDFQAIRIDGAILGLDLTGETLPGGKLVLGLAADIAVDLEQQTLELSSLALDALNMKITGNVSGKGITGDDPRFSGTFSINEFVPRDVIKALGQEPPVTADSTVLGNADAMLGWEASLRHVDAKTIQVKLDDTKLSGNLRVADFDNPAITFTLRADQIDIDRYLPPPGEASEPEAATPATAAAGGAGGLPVETLRGLNLDGTLTLDSLKAYNLRSTDIEVRIKAQGGLLRINPASAKLYDGQSLDEHLTGVQAGPLLKDLSGDDTLLGTANLHASLTGAGATPEQIRKTLNGNAAFSFANGAVKGVNIVSLIRNAEAVLQGKSAPQDNQPNQTDFAELKGSATVTNGLVKNKDLSLKSPLLRIKGKGTINLPEETIDYLLKAKIVGSLEGQGGKVRSELKGVTIPVHIGGTFSKPTYTPDLAAALGDSAKEKAQEEIEKKTQDLLKDKLDKGTADKLLKGLFR